MTAPSVGATTRRDWFWPVCSGCRQDCRWSPWSPDDGFTCWTNCGGEPVEPLVPAQRRPAAPAPGRSVVDPLILAWLVTRPAGATARQVAEAHPDHKDRTIRNGLARLVEQGRIVRRTGSWTYVAVAG